jgi:thymidine phosphorylase
VAAEVEAALDEGGAAASFAAMVEAQGGDPRVVDDPWSVLPRAPERREVVMDRTGWVASIDAERLGRAAVVLGAGRLRKGDPVDPAVGIEFHLAIGDQVERTQPVAVVHHRDRSRADEAERAILAAITIGEIPVAAPPLMYGWHAWGSPAPGLREVEGA